MTTPAMRRDVEGLLLEVGEEGRGRVMRSSTAVALKSLMLGKERTLERRVEVKRAACLTTTWVPSSS